MFYYESIAMRAQFLIVSYNFAPQSAKLKLKVHAKCPKLLTINLQIAHCKSIERPLCGAQRGDLWANPPGDNLPAERARAPSQTRPNFKWKYHPLLELKIYDKL
jgi:hypothetical protein